jgi:F5/8 type C domain-containing protein/malectin (di-glucose binding ER protein)/fibronectin type III domain protein/PQQ enzyme-like repeat protein/putative pyrroloquinoline-quinone binding quinoprotein
MPKLDTWNRVRDAVLGLLVTSVMPLSCGTLADTGGRSEPTRSLAQAAIVKYNWLQFGGDSRHGSNNTLETQITPQNVAQLSQLFKINLPETIEGAPVVVTNVSMSSGTHDVAFVTTRSGFIVALDAYSGQTLWSAQPGSTNITMSSPAIDPSLVYVYSNGLDGYIHKYSISTGAEVTGGGWPELSTLKTQWEKGGTAITIATVGATNYLYMGVGGYDGDGGDYDGHVTAVNLGTGTQTVFNAMCSSQGNVHFTATSPDCAAGNKGGVWAKAGVTFDPATNRLYMGTGNGTFSPSSFLWGDSILALNPDGTGVNGGPVDSYTPSNYQNLQNSDLDLGSTNTLILANNGSKYPHLAAQSGKDAMLRLVNLDNMSGQGGPGHVAGEVSATALPTAGEVQNPCATWINPADSTTWIFVVSPSNGMNAMRLAVDGSGNPSLVPVWQEGGGGGGAHVANGVLYFAQNANVQALNPTTGALLWHNTGIGQIHWQAPVVVNGVMYVGDNGRQLTAFSVGTPPPLQDASLPPPQDAGASGALSRTGWVATASASGGGAPANALDGNSATRWSTGVAQTDGQWFQVDMAAAQTFNEITLDAATSTNDYPRGYQVFVSSDGVNFGSPVATGAGTAALVTVTFAAQTARYIKIVQTAAVSFWWSIAEFNVYNTGAAPPPAPQPPSGLVATAASSSSITLSWQASPTSGVTYSVFRATSPTFTPSVNNQIQSGLATLAFTDASLTASTTYSYYVEALDSGGSAASNEANATTSAACTSGCASVQINCGGGAVAPFAADEAFTGGGTINHANPIDLSAVTNPAPAAVYQSGRVDNFSYTISGFVAGSSHTIRLHFAETYFTAVGARVFSVSINGTSVLTSFDIYMAAGAANKALVEAFTENASASGSYLVQFTSVVNNSLISGIEIL